MATKLPRLPKANKSGQRDAITFARATIARGIVRDRVAQGLTQAELARRAKLQPAVLNRIEKAKVVPDEATMKRIDAALRPASAARTPASGRQTFGA